MQPVHSNNLAFLLSAALHGKDDRIVTPGFAVVGLFLLAVLMGVFLILILREKVKDRRRQAPAVALNFSRHAPPLPEKRSSRNPPQLPRQR